MAQPSPSQRTPRGGVSARAKKSADALLSRAYHYIGLDTKREMTTVSQPAVLLLGDMLMPRGERQEGIGPKLAQHLHREGDKFKVLNMAQRGYNSQWLRHDVRRVLKSTIVANADIAGVCVMVGSHDAVDPTNVQHVPLVQFRENLHDIVDAVRDMLGDNMGIIFISPPCIDEDRLVALPHEPWEPSKDYGEGE